MNKEILMSIEDVFSILGRGTVALGQIKCEEVKIDIALL